MVAAHLIEFHQMLEHFERKSLDSLLQPYRHSILSPFFKGKMYACQRKNPNARPDKAEPERRTG